MPKTFEEKGETYIVSDSVDSLDTESMVDKSVMQKILDRVSEATKPEENSIEEPIAQLNNLGIVLTLQSKNGLTKKQKITSLSGLLGEYIFREKCVVYDVVLSVNDFLKIPTCLHQEEARVIGVMLQHNEETVVNFKEEKFVKVKEFKATEFSNNMVCCRIVLST